MTAQTALKAAIRDVVGPAARTAGFKGSGTTWRSSNGLGDWAVVNVQSSSWSTSESLRCVINVALAPAPWLEWKRESIGSQPKAINESLGLIAIACIRQAPPPARTVGGRSVVIVMPRWQHRTWSSNLGSAGRNLALSKHGPPDLPRSPNPPTGPATGDVTDPLTLMEVGPVSFEEIDPTTGGVGNTGPPAAA